MKIGFIPIDNRPICYLFPKLIADIDKNIELFMPNRNFLGDLTKDADVNKLFDWLKQLPKLDAMIISLDTIAYGGLIPSRKSTLPIEVIQKRIETLKQILAPQKTKIYAFSSIMRISNNNINEEEKDYWSEYGKQIFEYSFNTSKYGHAKHNIPEHILNDYMLSRKRNFEINKMYLSLQKEHFFQTLIFSKDDCAEYGFNVDEAKQLQQLGGFIKTGADEIPLSLFSRAITGQIKIAPIFLENNDKNLISNYEDISIEDCVKGQIELAGCELAATEDADILLYVNNFKKYQGEIVMKQDTESYNGLWQQPKKPYMIADVRFANGADNAFVQQLLKTTLDKNFYGYAAWNTSANTLGGLICVAKTKFLAKKYNDKAFKKSQIIRFLDDWAYQANVRQQNFINLNDEMKQYENIIFSKFDLLTNLQYKLPWNRKFEVEIEFI